MANHFVYIWYGFWQQFINTSSLVEKISVVRKYRTDNYSMKFWTFTVTLTLNEATQSLDKTLELWWCMQPIKFGCKRIRSSVDRVETVISDCMSPHCDLDCEDSKLIFSHDTLAHYAASPHQVWLKEVESFRRYHLNKHWKCWTFVWPWPWTVI